MSETKRRYVNRNSTIKNVKFFDRTTGCDVDSRIVVVANFCREQENFETREFENNFQGAMKAVKYIQDFGSQRIILESTSTYHLTFYEVFQRFGLPVGILNPVKISRLIKTLGKNDKADARNIAMLAASFDLKISNMPNLTQRQIREHTHELDRLKNQRTQLINRLNTKLTSYGCNVFRELKVNSKSGLAIIQGICSGLSKEQIFSECWFGSDKKIPFLWDAFGELEMIPKFIFPFLTEIRQGIINFNEAIERKESECLDLIDELDLRDLVNLMVSVPFINEMLALRVIGEMGENFPERYPNAEAFAKAVGVVPNNEVSGGKVLKKSQEKGNKHLKIPLLNTVKPYCVMKSFDNPFQEFYQSIKGKAGFKRAISAVAKKTMYVLYAVVRDRKPFDAEIKSLHKPRKVYTINDRKFDETPVKFMTNGKSMSDRTDAEFLALVAVTNNENGEEN